MQKEGFNQYISLLNLLTPDRNFEFSGGKVVDNEIWIVFPIKI